MGMSGKFGSLKSAGLRMIVWVQQACTDVTQPPMWNSWVHADIGASSVRKATGSVTGEELSDRSREVQGYNRNSAAARVRELPVSGHDRELLRTC